MDKIIPRASIPPLLLTACAFLLLVPAHGTESCKFHVGSNASIEFPLELNGGDNSSVTFQMFRLDQPEPFYENGQKVLSALRPDQYGRFEVTSSQQGTNFTATLLIKDIQVNDSNVYILSLREMKDGEPLDQLVNAKVDVIPPSSDADCSISDTAYVSEWYEINCQATLSSEGDGNIACFQNTEAALPNGLMIVSPPIMKASFWVLLDSPINCCSYEINHQEDLSSCTDFVYYPANHSIITTPTASSSPKDTTDGGHHTRTPQDGTVQSTAVSSHSTSVLVTVPCSNHDNHHAFVVTMIALLCIVILIVIALAFWQCRGKKINLFKKWHVLEDLGDDLDNTTVEPRYKEVGYNKTLL